ncbi:MAG: hypothetical protein JNM18_08120 [Planctomycetaceae bacterium]|nr:hypothetical protein [Planctomycetaceae bacterium]
MTVWMCLIWWVLDAEPRPGEYTSAITAIDREFDQQLRALEAEAGWLKQREPWVNEDLRQAEQWFELHYPHQRDWWLGELEQVRQQRRQRWHARWQSVREQMAQVRQRWRRYREEVYVQDHSTMNRGVADHEP